MHIIMNESGGVWPTTVRVHKHLWIFPHLYFLLNPPHFHLTSPQFSIDQALQLSHAQKHPLISKISLGLK